MDGENDREKLADDQEENIKIYLGFVCWLQAFRSSDSSM